MPLGLSAMAKKDLRSAPSTRTIRQYFPLNFIAPELNVLFIIIRSMRYGFRLGLISYRQVIGVCAAVSIGYLYLWKIPLCCDSGSFLRQSSCSCSVIICRNLLSNDSYIMLALYFSR